MPHRTVQDTAHRSWPRRIPLRLVILVLGGLVTLAATACAGVQP